MEQALLNNYINQCLICISLQDVLLTLAEMFPTKPLPYLRQKISRRHGGERVLQELIEELLMEGGEEVEQVVDRGLQDSRVLGDQDQADLTLEISRQEEPQSEDPRPGTSREPQLRLQEDLVKLSIIFL